MNNGYRCTDDCYSYCSYSGWPYWGNTSLEEWAELRSNFQGQFSLPCKAENNRAVQMTRNWSVTFFSKNPHATNGSNGLWWQLMERRPRKNVGLWANSCCGQTCPIPFINWSNSLSKAVSGRRSKKLIWGLLRTVLLWWLETFWFPA